ncbi:hypothetical protein VTL71DRAFT_11722, partial [Oculimacula yallundae]
MKYRGSVLLYPVCSTVLWPAAASSRTTGPAEKTLNKGTQICQLGCHRKFDPGYRPVVHRLKHLQTTFRAPGILFVLYESTLDHAWTASSGR